MQPLLVTVPTLAVSTIYCLWAAYFRCQHHRRRLLCERVAYLLWVIAERMA
jgi:hypothetical protein